MKKPRKIPHFKSDEEVAAFWDTHDFTNYIKDTEPVDVVFEKPKKETISIRMEHGQIKELKRLADRVGLGYTSLIRSWIIEKLARLHQAQSRKAA
jgi:predicted DNA binding CopG/RHH family protein